MSISKSELLMGRDKEYPAEYTKQISSNLDVLCEKMNVIRSAYGSPMTVSSGWRPPTLNAATKNAAKTSKHLFGLACDIEDLDNVLWNWCISNLDILQSLGLYLEDRRWTPSWVHFQCGPPSSLKRIYIPSSKPAIKPELWNGKYDSKYDGPEL